MCDQTFFLSVFTGLADTLNTVRSSYSCFICLSVHTRCFAELKAGVGGSVKAEGSASQARLPSTQYSSRAQRLQHSRHQGAAQARGAAGGHWLQEETSIALAVRHSSYLGQIRELG